MVIGIVCIGRRRKLKIDKREPQK